MGKVLVALMSSLVVLSVAADDFYGAIDSEAARVETKVIQWRRHIHQNPELSHEEYETAALVARELRRLGFDTVETGVAGTGVVGTLVGGKPGPVVALRADMDALAVEEKTGLPFASVKTTLYKGKTVGVMHACGHDAHVAILLGVAELFSRVRDQLPGTVKFIFQPAEEGDEGLAGKQSWGAKLMVEEGVLAGTDKPEAIFALHVLPYSSGSLSYRAKGALAASDPFEITITGKQTHGAMPWLGIDTISIAGQMISAMQMIPARQLESTKAPTVITIGSIHGGVRGNIIPDEVVMKGTLRTLDKDIRQQALSQLKKTVEGVAALSGAKATIEFGPGYPITYNDPDLTERMRDTMARVAGEDNLFLMDPSTGSEDFSFFQQEIPGVIIMLGITDPKTEPSAIYANHSPRFVIDESALIVGVRALSHMAYDYMIQNPVH